VNDRIARRPAFVVLLVSALLCLGLAPARADADGLTHDGTLDICISPTLPPMEFINGSDNQDVAGVDVDVARALAAHWHARANLMTMDFVGLFPSLQSGRCAMVISGVVRQPAREARFDAVPYLPTSLVIVARAGTKPLHAMSELSGRTLAVESGTSYAAKIAQENPLLVAAGKPPIVIQQYPSEDQAIQQVLIGRADAFVSQDVSLYYRRTQLHGKVAVIFQPDYDEFREFAIYISKGSTQRAALNDAVQTLHTSGQMAQILHRWHVGSSQAVAQAVQPEKSRFDWSVFASALIAPAFLHGAFITLAMALLSHATAIALSLPMAMVLNGKRSVLSRLIGGYVALFRAAPTLLQLLFVWNALPQFFPIFREAWFTPFLAAWIALSLNEAAYQVEINRAALGAIDAGQFIAGEALGLSRLQTYRHVIFPQALRVALPATINEFINLLKTTSLASVISLHELMTVTQVNVSRSFAFSEYYAVALVYYVAMVFCLIAMQKRIERRFVWVNRVAETSHD